MAMIEEDGAILVFNAGSSSIKYALFDSALSEILSGQVTDIRGGHSAALAGILDALDQRGHPATTLRAAAHRVVHGGAKMSAPCRIDAQVINHIRACIPLAPLHNPHNLNGILALADIAPDLAQYATFDTAFHAGNPEVAKRYAVPADWNDMGFRRYGFHGTSYQSLVASFEDVTGTLVPKRLLAFHLGNGASICAIRDGQSVATTMGYSPLEGLTMGTRSGDIDANAVLDMADQIGITQTRQALNSASGLAGLSGGASDMKTLCTSDDDNARFAVKHFCYWAARHAGSMIAAMGGVDGIAFTGGIGENSDAIQAEILSHLQWTGITHTNTWVIPAQEERQIAKNAIELMH